MEELNRLEQVQLNMPEARIYFAGDREQKAEDLSAYIGTEQLTFQSLTKFSDTGQGIGYYVLLDVSASVSDAAFRDIVSGLRKLSSELKDEDQMILVTFGESVETAFELTGTELRDGKGGEVFDGLVNRDQRTLLFEAIQQAARMAETAQGSQSMQSGATGQPGAAGNLRRVAFVITDGEDIARGKATKDEALNTLGRIGMPVYGFTVNESKREYMNAFGEFSRSAGGHLTILEHGAAADGFASVQQELLDSYEAVFTAGTNRVSRGMVPVTLEFAGEGGTRQMEAMQNRWIADEEHPVIQSIVSNNAKQLQLQFSEPVEGAEAAESYQLTGEDGVYHIPAFASVGNDGASAVLSFTEELGGGTYELSCDGITDQSMEKNALEGTAFVQVENYASAGAGQNGAEQSGAGQSTTEQSGTGEADAQTAGTNPVIYGAVAGVLVLGIAAALMWKKKKKAQVPVNQQAVGGSSGEVRDGGKVNLPGGVPETRTHVSVEKRQLEEKRVFFHVKGQKEEISVKITSSLIVGRSSACQLIFDDPALSRQHFVLELVNGAVMIRNLSESGFTTVNGSRLGSVSYRLKPGDEIGAGQLKMAIRWQL